MPATTSGRCSVRFHDIESFIVDSIRECTQVVGCVAWLRSRGIMRALSNVPCTIVITNDTKLPDYSSLTPFLSCHPTAVVKVGLARGRFRGLQHNKFIVGLKNGKPSFVITGSFNYTEQASTQNLENVVRIDDSSCADAYMREALAIMAIAKPCKPPRCKARLTKRRRI